MSERLEEMLRIARAATRGPWELSARLGPHGGSEGFYRISAANTLCLEVRPCADGYVPGQNAANAQHIATFNPRTAEALVKGMQVLVEVRKIISEGAMEGFNPKVGDWAERLFASQGDTSRALSALTAAMEDNSNVG